MITYLPSKFLSKTMPKSKIEKLITKKLTINKAILNTLADSEILSEKTIMNIALKVKKNIKKRYEEYKEEQIERPLEEAINDNRQLIQHIQNATVYEISDEIKKQYLGEYYIWLPSDAENPDPLHQLKYGKKYQIGKGEMPGERWGCRCGMRILTDEKKLEL